MRLDPSNPLPLFQQIADAIRGEMARGAFIAGDAIPSVRAQALRLRTNPNTVQRAYEQLEREGLIEPRKGLGMFVTRRAEEAARERAARALREALVTAVRSGLIAGLARRQIDQAYAAAWAQQPGPEAQEKL